ncbi:GD21884 [Drosophila simulans]|uniref:GD21884 n=1 Tax=Drosophila simulans TaxID=7240 RepID=B4Q7V5_DROSI|nr:GD21884 [Drosophila simulans]
MYNHIKGLHIDEYQGENEDNTRKLACEGTVKLNANAQEFVPRFKREQPAKEDAIVGNSNIGNTINDVQKPKTNLMLPWKGFPNKPQKPSRSPQVVLLNDVDYIVVPSTKRLKKPIDQLLVENVPTAPSKVHSNDPAPAANRIDHEERRREHERKVAVEALKLAEQRRMRDPVIAPTEVNENSKNVRPIINISRSPIKFTPEERIKVDRLRAAKRERIERILREMTNSKQAQVKKSSQQRADMHMTIAMTANYLLGNNDVPDKESPPRMADMLQLGNGLKNKGSSTSCGPLVDSWILDGALSTITDRRKLKDSADKKGDNKKE